MTQDTKAPEGQVADAVKGNWVDTLAPPWMRPYFRLSRADRPIGTWLLFIPCIWAVLLAALSDAPRSWDIWLIVSCGAGAWLMRGAGCTWNDIADRKFDAEVARTKSRPLPSGQVTVRNAVIWMCLQALVAFGILLSYGMPTIAVGIASLVFVCIYPFAKRFTWWPQVFLGLAFNWGALLGWVAHRGDLTLAPVLLYLAGIAWTLFYDTIYAHQDTEDDALIGIKSTARLFADKTPLWLGRFMVMSAILLFGAVLVGGPSGPGVGCAMG
ncbi:MAG: 4-hydroxybenzoate octaprenyltransferase, partial [Pseudomonadota bacterium]